MDPLPIWIAYSSALLSSSNLDSPQRSNISSSFSGSAKVSLRAGESLDQVQGSFLWTQPTLTL